VVVVAVAVVVTVFRINAPLEGGAFKRWGRLIEALRYMVVILKS